LERLEDPNSPPGNTIEPGCTDLDHFDVISEDTQLQEFVLGLVSMVPVEDDAAVFYVGAGSQGLLKLVRKSRQVDAISNQIMWLDNGHEPS